MQLGVGIVCGFWACIDVDGRLDLDVSLSLNLDMNMNMNMNIWDKCEGGGWIKLSFLVWMGLRYSDREFNCVSVVCVSPDESCWTHFKVSGVY